MPQSDKGWSCAKLTDERATLVLEQMNANLKLGNVRAAKVTGAMLLREFLMLRVAPLQARTRPLWRLGDEEDKVHLSSETLPDGELAAALCLLVGDDQEYPPTVFIPLFRRKDGAQAVAARLTFDRRGLVPLAPTGAPVAPTPVELSSGEGEPPVVPTRGRSALVSRDAAPALTPPGAASGPSAAPSSAPGARAPAPQALRLSGFKLSKRRVDYATVDQPPPAAKKRKEDAATPPGTEPSAAAAPPSVKKGSDDTRTSPVRSSSRGLEEHPRGESAPMAPLAPEALVSSPAARVPKAQEPPVSQALVTMLCPPPTAPLLPGPSASPDVLERALLEMTRLREDLQGPDRHLAAGRLELVSDWLHSDTCVRATLSQAAAISEKERQAAAQAAVAREVALKDAETAQDHCRALEAELKNLRDLRAEEARGGQAEEEKMKAREDAIKDHDAELGEKSVRRIVSEEPVLTEKNNMLSHDLEKCRTQLAVVIAELEKSKEAPPGSVDQLKEELKVAQAGEQEAKRQLAAGERVLTQVRDDKNKLQDSNNLLGEERKDQKNELIDLCLQVC
nr:uncharacterized protein KIAA1522-like [Aegilops tauschii subsp. strangulata]